MEERIKERRRAKLRSTQGQRVT